MIPLDNEYIILYLLYSSMILYLVFGIIKSEEKLFFIINSIVFGIYLSIMIYIFSDAENFKYGGSLVVLFYGLLLIILHFIIIGLIELIRAYKK